MSWRGAEDERHSCNCGRLSNDHFLPPLDSGGALARSRRRRFSNAINATAVQSDNPIREQLSVMLNGRGHPRQSDLTMATNLGEYRRRRRTRAFYRVRNRA
jgi:hypothetical protein